MKACAEFWSDFAGLQRTFGKTLGNIGGMERFCRVAARSWKKTLGNTGGMGRFSRVAARSWKNIREYWGNGAVSQVCSAHLEKH